MLPIEAFTIADIDSLYHLLEQSFPADEFRDYGGQRALFAHPRYHPCGLRDERGDVKALLTVWDFDTFVYIEHFAVSPAARNGGIGSALLQQVTAPMQKPVCLEVELPESDITRRRIGFYRRNGFFLNDYPYIQPSLGVGRAPQPLRIMTRDGTITQTEFETMRDVIYREVYRVDTEASNGLLFLSCQKK